MLISDDVQGQNPVRSVAKGDQTQELIYFRPLVSVQGLTAIEKIVRGSTLSIPLFFHFECDTTQKLPYWL